MNMFDTGLSIKDTAKKIKEYSKKINNITENSGKSKTTFRLLDGSEKNFGDCVLFIRPGVATTGFMASKYDKKLLELCSNYNIDKKIITYGVLKRSKLIGRNIIKLNIKVIEDIISITKPKLIVCIGEVTSELFLSTKKKICKFHGTELIKYNDIIPVLYTYDMDWYIEKDSYEDNRYKLEIQRTDWTLIQKRYNQLCQ